MKPNMNLKEASHTLSLEECIAAVNKVPIEAWEPYFYRAEYTHEITSYKYTYDSDGLVIEINGEVVTTPDYWIQINSDNYILGKYVKRWDHPENSGLEVAFKKIHSTYSKFARKRALNQERKLERKAFAKVKALLKR